MFWSNLRKKGIIDVYFMRFKKEHNTAAIWIRIPTAWDNISVIFFGLGHLRAIDTGDEAHRLL